MATKKSMKKALRAAQSVVRGSRRRGATAAAGLLLVSAAGCSSSEGSLKKGDVSQPDIMADLNEILLDSFGADVQGDAPVQEIAEAETGTLDVTPSDLPSPPDDAWGHGHNDGAAWGDLGDAVADCIMGCYMPNETVCETYSDCEHDEIPGTCSASGAECTPAQACPASEECEGYDWPLYAQLDPDGQPSIWSPITCMDGFCHEGMGVGNAAVDECCMTGWENLCPGVQVLAGCTPWGPPAPPVFDPRAPKVA